MLLGGAYAAPLIAKSAASLFKIPTLDDLDQRGGHGYGGEDPECFRTTFKDTTKFITYRCLSVLVEEK